MLRLLLVFGCIFSNLPAKIPQKPKGWDEWAFYQKVKWRGRNLDPRINYPLLADKLRVKEYVEPFVKVAKVYYATKDSRTISVENLPSTFVMKANHGWNFNLFVIEGVAVAQKKRDTTFEQEPVSNSYLQQVAKGWLKSTYNRRSEKHYRLIKPAVFFEEHLGENLQEYQFYCFYGVAKYIRLLRDLYEEKSTYSLYDRNWNYVDASCGYFKVAEPEPKPAQFEDMLAIAETLSSGIDFVRLDLFLVDGEVYFGEYTFTPSGGWPSFSKEFEEELGRLWAFPTADRL